MPTLTLDRLAYLDQGTFGRLLFPSGISLYTVERPWINNAPRISCIPEGEYSLVPKQFFRGGYQTYELVEVPGRSHILIHIANWPHEVEGCIGVGTGLNLANFQVVNSKTGFAYFKAGADALYEATKTLSIEITSETTKIPKQEEDEHT